MSKLLILLSFVVASECFQQEITTHIALQRQMPSYGTVQTLFHTEGVSFFDGDSSIKQISVSPGETFTVNLVNGHLFIGRNIKGKDGRTGGHRSHIQFNEVINFHAKYAGGAFEDVLAVRDENRVYGSIRINADGSIDISGRSNQKDNEEFAKKIEQVLQEKAPGLKVRSFGQALRDVPFD